MTRQALLLKPIWNNENICFFAECKKTKAYEIMKVAKQKYNGKVACDSRCVKRDSVLLVMGTSIEREVYLLKILKKGGVNEEEIQS